MQTWKLQDALDKDLYDAILQECEIQTFAKNSYIFMEHDIPHYFYILLEGKIFIQKTSEDGNTNIVTVVCESGDCFAEVYFFLKQPYPFDAYVTQQAKLLCIGQKQLEKYPQLSMHLNTILAHKAYTLSLKLQLLSCDRLEQKILAYLKMHPTYVLNRQQMAEYLHVTRPALSKKISQMLQDGILVLEEDGKLKIKM